MYTQIQKTIPAYYKNRGQQAERVFRYTNTGLLCKADNTPCTVSGDCGDVQVKSARATVCKGLDIESYIDTDKANSYAYITADYSIAYIMNPIEWITFVKAFSTVTKESNKNGGGLKIRLKQENKAMLKWLADRA